MRPRRKRNRDLVSGFFRRLLDTHASGQDDQVCQRDFLASVRCAIERALDIFQRLEHFGQLSRVVDFPIFLRCQANAGTVRTAALIGATESGRRRPSGGNQFRDGEAGRQNLALQGGDVLTIDQGVIDRRDGILPDQLLGGNVRPEITGAGSHIAMR